MLDVIASTSSPLILSLPKNLNPERVILSLSKNLNPSYSFSRADPSVTSFPQDDITQEPYEAD